MAHENRILLTLVDATLFLYVNYSRMKLRFVPQCTKFRKLCCPKSSLPTYLRTATATAIERHTHTAALMLLLCDAALLCYTHQ
jgi:hypothetical protein